MNPDDKNAQLQGITDLTLLTRIKKGYVPGAINVVSFEERLRHVLIILNSVRKKSREVSLQPSPFTDLVGLFRGVHFFRFAIVPVEHQQGRHDLFLHVTFDGGWESYMRIIWKPLGSMLDLIFCHCEGYPLARESSFSEYMHWVREQETRGGFFYADSDSTVADSDYLRRLGELQINRGDLPDFDKFASQLNLPSPHTEARPTPFAIEISLKAFKIIGSLRGLFPETKDRQSSPPFEQNKVLQRFAQDLLPDLRT